MNYLIEETTKEERTQLVYKALGISMSGADKPSDEVMNLVKKYINGIMELEEVQKEVIMMYENKESE